MSYLCKIKLAGVTNLSDARFAAAAGFDYIGFCFDQTQAAYIPPVKAREIIDWTTGSNITGEFGNQSVQEINDIAELLDLDIIEVNNALLPEELDLLNKPVIKQINLYQLNGDKLMKEVEAYGNYCAAFLLHLDHYKEEWVDQIAALNKDREIFISGISQIDLLYQLASSLQIGGITISGGAEEATGLKDFDYLNELSERFTIIE